MGMSDSYGPADRAESVATIHAALDAGITLLDTGDFYGTGHNERLLAAAPSLRISTSEITNAGTTATPQNNGQAIARAVGTPGRDMTVGIEMWRARNRRVRWLLQRFPDGPQSGSHNHHVSTSLPAIPDSRVSRIRF